MPVTDYFVSSEHISAELLAEQINHRATTYAALQEEIDEFSTKPDALVLNMRSKRSTTARIAVKKLRVKQKPLAEDIRDYADIGFRRFGPEFLERLNEVARAFLHLN